MLVDTLLALAPLALYARLGEMGAPLCGVLVIFYRGLVACSKSFLDPFGNEQTDVEIEVPVLVRDLNGASTRFLEAAEALPVGYE